ncbi:recombinase family protein [Mesorhizobium denitrificans]|uniref:Recombinase family protein n=1 Tax=Mesorhizobium denitrificans TaxID=2294114 RepID=A0A371XDR3_9HYPH|nr:recombinase family protein [Mesorhizobium denitrificans]RFC67379.1 recombinase family protein [Mesorhizobium denitrificans]
MSTILYARVSTLDQNATHQRAQAEASGFKIDDALFEEGVSGVTTRLQDRPQGKRLYDKLRPGDTLVVRWVDRLGRNYQDVTEAIRDFMARGVVIRTVINNMTFDGATKDPVQKAVRDALIAFMAATAEAQAEATKSAQRVGIDARKGDETRYRGKKPSYDRATFEKVVDLLGNGAGASAIAKATGVSRQSVLRIRDDRANAEKALAKWDVA